MGAQRELAAIVFLDAVGFSARANANEEQVLRLLEQDLRIARTSCLAHEGQVLKTLGDGMMLAFSSAVQAVRFARDIQRRNDERIAEPLPLQYRIGIHLGDVLLTEDDAHGDGVNVAARIEQAAQPGAIWLSEPTYAVVKGKIDDEPRYVGMRALKGLDEPIGLYEYPPLGTRMSRRTIKRRPQNWATVAAAGVLGASIITGALIMRKPDGAIQSPMEFLKMMKGLSDAESLKQNQADLSPINDLVPPEVRALENKIILEHGFGFDPTRLRREIPQPPGATRSSDRKAKSQSAPSAPPTGDPATADPENADPESVAIEAREL